MLETKEDRKYRKGGMRLDALTGLLDGGMGTWAVGPGYRGRRRWRRGREGRCGGEGACGVVGVVVGVEALGYGRRGVVGEW